MRNNNFIIINIFDEHKDTYQDTIYKALQNLLYAKNIDTNDTYLKPIKDT